MAKRTNKTDHVLNLLAGATKQEEGVEATGSKAQPPIDPLAKMSGNVSVHHTSDNGEAPIAEAVKQSLEKELLRELDETNDTAVEEQSSPKKTKAEETPIELEEETVTMVSAQEKVKEIPREEISEELKVPEQPVSEEGEKEPSMQEVSVQPEAAVQEKIEKEEEKLVEHDFAFVNVMEHLVREQAEYYMERFGNCMCARCVEDVTALALSNIPAKYVVVNKAAVSPLLSFYAKRFAGQITVEVTKACMIVQENPNH